MSVSIFYLNFLEFFSLTNIGKLTNVNAIYAFHIKQIFQCVKKITYNFFPFRDDM